MLNESQQAIIDHWNKPFNCEAPAGTGKTFTIKSLVESKVKNGVSPENILVLTFTNLAKRNLEESLSKLDIDLTGITCNTFHSFCYSVLKTYSDFTGYSSNLITADFEFTKYVVTNYLKSKGMNFDVEDITRKLEQLDEFVFVNEGNLQKAHSLFLDRNSKYMYKLSYEGAGTNPCTLRQFYTGPLTAKHPSLLKLYNFYIATLNNTNHITFNNILVYFRKLLKNKEILAIMQEKYTHVILDESQDTTEYEFMTVIEFMKNSSVMQLFGDKNQLLYEWKGVRPDTVYDKFYHKFPNAKDFALNITYRSCPKIAALNNIFLSKAGLKSTNVIPDDSIIERGITGDVTCKTYMDPDHFYNELPHLLKQEQGKTCILFKTNAQVEECCKALEAEGLYPTTSNTINLFKNSIIVELLAAYKYVLNPMNTYVINTLIQGSLIDTKQETVAIINSLSKKYKLPISILLNSILLNQFEPAYTNHEVAVLDIETTGLEAEDQIVEIACIIVGKDGIKDKYISYVKVEDVGESVNVHHITNEFLEQYGTTLDEALGGLCDFYCKHNVKITVGHNIRYDVNKINYDYNKIYNTPLIGMSTCLDTLHLARISIKADSYKLEDLSKSLELPHQSTHNAYDDILATYYLLEKCKPEIPHELYLILQDPSILEVTERLYGLYQTLADQKISLSFHKFFYKIVDYSALKNPQKESDISKIYTHITNFLKDLIYLENDQTVYQTIANLVEYINLHGSEVNKTIFQESQLFVFTEYASKGLEFDNVIYCTSPNYIPKGVTVLKKADARVFYTAMSRAKQKVCFVKYEDKNTALHSVIEDILNEGILENYTFETQDSISNASWVDIDNLKV